MATYESLDLVTFKAGAAIAQPYLCVKMGVADRTVIVNDDVDAPGIVGFVQDTATTAGEAIGVGIYGVSKARCGGTVTRGGSLASDVNGFVVNAASGSRRVGIALSAGSTNDVIPILITIGGELA